jgi:RNA polymerase sigma-70 factor, ECF subfamily
MAEQTTKTDTGRTLAALPLRTRHWSFADIAMGVARRDPLAGQAFYERYGSHVKARVRRLLGPDSEYEDQVQQVFYHLISAMGKLRNPDLMDRWVDRIVINTVRKELRRRRRKRFLLYTSDVPEQESAGVQETSVLFHRAASLVDTLVPDEKIAFVLRFVVTEEVGTIADICGWSLSTTKRRIARAKENFEKKAMRDPILRSFKEEIAGEN